VIRQGDVFWVDTADPVGSRPAYRRPYVVVQNNVLNGSRIRTVLACGLTTTLKRSASPGNVLLDPGEGNLPERSVVNVSQVMTFHKTEMQEWIGTLSPKRVREILRGINLLLEPREPSAV
jgi:mRNA interferase MazF